eukprot:m.119782 g.119782  ORF g.119782 m.119782 type:complete len:484 (-) comp12913_c0_seq3:2523-3974(-)
MDEREVKQLRAVLETAGLAQGPPLACGTVVIDSPDSLHAYVDDQLKDSYLAVNKGASIEILQFEGPRGAWICRKCSDGDVGFVNCNMFELERTSIDKETVLELFHQTRKSIDGNEGNTNEAEEKKQKKDERQCGQEDVSSEAPEVLRRKHRSSSSFSWRRSRSMEMDPQELVNFLEEYRSPTSIGLVEAQKSQKFPHPGYLSMQKGEKFELLAKETKAGLEDLWIAQNIFGHVGLVGIGDVKLVHDYYKFGCDVSIIFQATHQPVPEVVSSCIKYLRLYGMRASGLFRVPGRAATISQLQHSFESQCDPLEDALPSTVSVHAVAGLLKQFLRDLPASTITSTLYDTFIEVSKLEVEEQMDRLRESLSNYLPVAHKFLLFVVLQFLAEVALFSDDNMMTASNLAVVFAPTLLRRRVHSVCLLLILPPSRLWCLWYHCCHCQLPISKFQFQFLFFPQTICNFTSTQILAHCTSRGLCRMAHHILQ